jgi:hypothetical protein
MTEQAGRCGSCRHWTGEGDLRTCSLIENFGTDECQVHGMHTEGYILTKATFGCVLHEAAVTDNDLSDVCGGDGQNCRWCR